MILEWVELTVIEGLFLCLIIFGAAVIRGYAGFGFSAIVVASASLFMPTLEAVIIVLFLEVIASLQMAKKVWKDMNRRLCFYILVTSACSIPLGLTVLRWVDIDMMRLINAAMLLLAVGLNVKGQFMRINNAPSGWMVTGAISGFMNGMLAMGGLWITLFLINSGIRVVSLRACLVGLFFYY